MQGKVKVGVGVTSQVGYGVTLAALLAAIVAYIQGDHSIENATTLGLGIVAGISYVITQLGRYAQAHAHAKALPQVLENERYAAQEYSEADFADPEPEEPSWLKQDQELAAEHNAKVSAKANARAWEDAGAGYEPGMNVAGSWDQDQAKIAAADKAMVGLEVPHDLEDEPPDTGSDTVPMHERRDLHDGGRC